MRYTGTLDQRHMAAALDTRFSFDMQPQEPGLTRAGYDKACDVILHCGLAVAEAVRDGTIALDDAHVLRHLTTAQWYAALQNAAVPQLAAEVRAAGTASRMGVFRGRGQRNGALRTFWGWLTGKAPPPDKGGR